MQYVDLDGQSVIGYEFGNDSTWQVWPDSLSYQQFLTEEAPVVYDKLHYNVFYVRLQNELYLEKYWQTHNFVNLMSIRSRLFLYRTIPMNIKLSPRCYISYRSFFMERTNICNLCGHQEGIFSFGLF